MLKVLMAFVAVSEVQETRERVFGHQTIDPVLCLVKCINTHTVHHTQQILPGLGVQIYLRGKQIIKYSRLQSAIIHVNRSFFFFFFNCSLNLNHAVLSTNLQWAAGG